jgi:hypothetical protein
MKKLQERPFLCNVMDFTGRVPVLEAGKFGVFRRATFIVTGEEIGVIGWPLDWTDEKAKQALDEHFKEGTQDNKKD